jgi:hypothetical protein
LTAFLKIIFFKSHSLFEIAYPNGSLECMSKNNFQTG